MSFMDSYRNLDAMYSGIMKINLATTFKIGFDIIFIPVIIMLLYFALVDLTNPFGNFDKKERALRDMGMIGMAIILSFCVYYLNFRLK